MFWRFGGYASISPIDTLLNKPDVTLEELLDESELIQELKQHNTKLIEYLREDNVLKRLMEYVIAPPFINDDEEQDGGEDTKLVRDGDTEEENNKSNRKRGISEIHDLENAEKTRSKYAYVACEILSSETWSILESMILNEAYLRNFWRFMKRPAPLDSLQAGYFTKVNETLFDRKTEEMLAFYKSLKGIVPAMLQHVDNPMVMDLLLKIISLERAEGGQGIVDWLKVQNLVPFLLSYLSPEHPASVQTAAGDFLKAIITISANATQNEQSCIGPNSLTRQLVSAPCVSKLISFMLQGGNSLTVGVGIVIEVIRKNNSDYDPENAGGPDSAPTTYDPIYLGGLLRLFAKHIPDFMALILSSKHTVTENGRNRLIDRGELNSAWGTKIEPLGFDRFKTCELMAELLHCSNMGLLNESGSEEYIRQRDEERERLCSRAGFEPPNSENSVNDYAHKMDYRNGSIPSSRPPEDLKAFEIANISEEDGFEDVGSSTVLVGGARGDAGEAGSEQEAKISSFQVPLSSKFDVNDEFVDEPLVSPKQMASAERNTNDRAISVTSQSQTHGRISPTASGLTEGVGEIRIHGEEPVHEDFNSRHRTSTEMTSLNPMVNHCQQAHPQQLADSTVAFPGQSAPVTKLEYKATRSSSQPLIAPEAGNVLASQNPEPTAEGMPEPFSVVIDNTDQHFFPQIQYDPDGHPVVGDYLKIMFVENRVVPTILGFFFRFPWNNFLHNVVYDVVQQVFNGPMDRGFNRSLAIDLFETGHITEQIVNGQRRSDDVQTTTHVRLGYMGHLTLIAEEVVKFTERHPPEVLSQTVMEKVLHSDWIDYVERTLSETRERDNAILGGVRPEMSIGARQAVLNAVGASQGYINSPALANAGLNGGGEPNFGAFDIMNHASASGGVFGLGGGNNSLLSSFGSSSDDEDEEMEDQDDEEGKNTTEHLTEGGSENAPSGSTSHPISPPPAPLNIAPSRARRQLAARLALHRQQASEATPNPDKPSSDFDTKHINRIGHEAEPWQSNPFVISAFEDEAPPNFQFSDSSLHRDGTLLSPTFPRTGFTPPGSPSTSSSDDADEGTPEAVRRKVRIPLEVDDDGDEEGDDDMGEMVAPSSGPDMVDSDEETEAIMNESFGYPNFYSTNRYGGLGRSHIKDTSGQSHFSDNADGHSDSSDGEGDEGLVEILFPGRKRSDSK